jgi:hypothetical protein
MKVSQMQLQRFNKNRWWPLTAFLLKILDNVSSSGSGAGFGATSHRGITLKGTKVSHLYKYFKYIFLTIPGIFGSPSDISWFIKLNCLRFIIFSTDVFWIFVLFLSVV